MQPIFGSKLSETTSLRCQNILKTRRLVQPSRFRWPKIFQMAVPRADKPPSAFQQFSKGGASYYKSSFGGKKFSKGGASRKPPSAAKIFSKDGVSRRIVAFSGHIIFQGRRSAPPRRLRQSKFSKGGALRRKDRVWWVRETKSIV